MLDNWQRIEKIVKWSGASSVNAFARDIGLNRSENLYQIKRGNNGISRELSDIIATKYPALSRAWILTGEGEMLKDDATGNKKYAIPYYNIDAVGLLTSSERIKPQYTLSLPLFEGCEFAAMYYGDAMAPEILGGAILLCRPAATHSIMPGEIYLVISSVFNGVRRIRRSTDDKRLRLVASNTDRFDEVTIVPSAIEKLYHIAGVITKTI